ncbi:helix-turn-helix domain-containing protein [bacterium]|nr:helix-turn-helix domain-containing protein [bacterium]
MNLPDSCRELLTPDETATLLRTTRRAIYAMAQRAQLPGVVRIGRRLLVRRDDLYAHLGLPVPDPAESGRTGPHEADQSTGYQSPPERACPRTPNNRRQGP